MTMSNPSQFDLEVNLCSKHWLLTVLHNKYTRSKFTSINLYMPNRYMEKVECWRSMLSFKDKLDLPICIVAWVFNTILQNKEKRGGNSVRDPMWEMMEDLLFDCDLNGVKLSKGKYTWSNKRLGPSHIATQLNRFLIHNNYLLHPLSISSNIIQSTIYDHKPISLPLSPPQKFGPIPLCFNPLWLHNPSKISIIK